MLLSSDSAEGYRGTMSDPIQAVPGRGDRKALLEPRPLLGGTIRIDPHEEQAGRGPSTVQGVATGMEGSSAYGIQPRNVKQVEFLDRLAEIIAQAILADQGGGV